MSDTIKARALEAMAAAIEGCESPYNSDALATAALTALHRFHAAEGLRMGAPVVATEGMKAEAIHNMPPRGEITTEWHGVVFETMLDAALNPFAPEPGA